MNNINIDITIYIASHTPITNREISLFQTNHTLNVIRTNNYHDRFIIIDRNKLYHLERNTILKKKKRETDRESNKTELWSRGSLHLLSSLRKSLWSVHTHQFYKNKITARRVLGKGKEMLS